MSVEGINKAHLVGNSAGCQIIADFAVRYPTRVGCVVLQGPTTDATARTHLKQTLRWFKDGMYEPPSLMLVLARDYADCGLRRLVQTFGHLLDDAIEEKAPHLLAPTLVVRGSKDPIVSQRWCEMLADLLPNGRLVVIPGVPHTINYAAADDLVRVMLPFFEQHSNKGGLS
jgi:2-hydroxy-6-oxonona-2,4-dienedioate hydrolase